MRGEGAHGPADLLVWAAVGARKGQRPSSGLARQKGAGALAMEAAALQHGTSKVWPRRALREGFAAQTSTRMGESHGTQAWTVL